MKKLWWIVSMLLVLTGCSGEWVLETVADLYCQPEPEPPRQILLQLPSEAALPVMENEAGERIYLCDGYSITVQTLDAGDLDATLRYVTGYAREKLEVLETALSGCKRYESVWSAAGEAGDQVGRVVVLDDGSYHYTVTVMASAADAGRLTEAWQRLLSSIALGQY